MTHLAVDFACQLSAGLPFNGRESTLQIDSIQRITHQTRRSALPNLDASSMDHRRLALLPCGEACDSEADCAQGLPAAGFLSLRVKDSSSEATQKPSSSASCGCSLYVSLSLTQGFVYILESSMVMASSMVSWSGRR